MCDNVHVQEAREKDISITDEMARSALGALGLTGEAALRPIKALSGTSYAMDLAWSNVLILLFIPLRPLEKSNEKN